MSGTLAFHYGNFDNHYGDDTRAKAAKNGRIYSDTLTSGISYAKINDCFVGADGIVPASR